MLSSCSPFPPPTRYGLKAGFSSARESSPRKKWRSTKHNVPSLTCRTSRKTPSFDWFLQQVTPFLITSCVASFRRRKKVFAGTLETATNVWYQQHPAAASSHMVWPPFKCLVRYVYLRLLDVGAPLVVCHFIVAFLLDLGVLLEDVCHGSLKWAEPRGKGRVLHGTSASTKGKLVMYFASLQSRKGSFIWFSRSGKRRRGSTERGESASASRSGWEHNFDIAA